MKLDEKYFVPFIAIVAVVAALIIVFFTVSNRQGREEAFKESIAEQDSLRYHRMPVLNSTTDSLSISSFSDQFVILDFWASWTESFSRQSHRQLANLKEQYPGKVEIIAAVVRDKPEKTQEYINRYDYPFHFVEGTAVFNGFNVPGVPTQLVYRPNGKLSSVFTGYADSTRMDSLQTLIRNE
ncbi:MAG: TlpA family protein disulfide reductase [Balneolaceae bacterium]|nr:TlpA family protein disulfide reductase [Balneolaceae bacterium]